MVIGKALNPGVNYLGNSNAWGLPPRRNWKACLSAFGDNPVRVLVPLLEFNQYGRRAPSPLAAKLVAKFLDEHPQITGVPEYRNKTKLTAENLVEIRRRSKNGEKLREIADSFGLSESYISRIVRGERPPRVSV